MYAPVLSVPRTSDEEVHGRVVHESRFCALGCIAEGAEDSSGLADQAEVGGFEALNHTG